MEFKSIHAVLLIFFLLIVFILIQHFSGIEKVRSLETECMQSFSGVVTQKYRNNRNHNYPFIHFKYHAQDYKIAALDYKNLYEYIDIGDSIIKFKNSMKIIVKRSTGDTAIFARDYRALPKNSPCYQEK